MSLNPEPTVGKSDWFVKERFGLFIHWGLYAQGARHEWLQNNEQIPADVYQRKYFKRFNPDLYQPAQWAKAAKNAGMKYFVITTKHHEGFALWDSKLTDYKATNTAYGRDLIRPMVEAFRAEGLHTGFYHSLIDWHHEHYIQDAHIGPNRAHPERAKLNEGRQQALYAKYLHGQVEELLSQYGKVDILWLDFSYPRPDGSGKGNKDWDSANLIKLVRRLQPEIMLNDRLDLDYGWDFKTPEQYMPRGWVMINGKPVVWEGCHTFSGSWGYHRDEKTWKSVEMLVKMLVDSVSKGGNLLLNVGPTGRGEFDERALDRLAGMGEWMKRHDRAIYGCTQAPAGMKCPEDCRLTWNPETKRLYIHVMSWPFRNLFLDGFGERLEYAQLLNDASEVTFKVNKEKDEIAFNLPVDPPRNAVVPVIECFLKD